MSSVQAAIARLAKIRYVVVVRTLTYQAPVVADHSFTPGHLPGEARVIGVDGTDHGGVRFAADNSNTVDYRTEVDQRTGTTHDSDKYRAPEANLLDNAINNFTKALDAVAPNSALSALAPL